MPLEELKQTIVYIVRSRGKELDEEDFVQFLSYIKGWISPDEARRLFRACVDANLLEKKGDKYVPTFEYKGVIPLGFKVTKEMVDKLTVEDTISAKILDRITKEGGVSRRNALFAINEIKKEARYITLEVAALIYCKMLGLDCTDYYDEVERMLVV
jgi:hypothetical protein